MEHFFSEALLGFSLIIDGSVILYLTIGVICGMLLGIIPGFSGTTGMVLLMPFVFYLDTAGAMALLLGMYVSTTVTDVLPAILIGVPGTASAQAHVLDGYKLAKKGEGSRAIAAAYFSDLFGATFGVLFFVVLYPILTILTLAFGSPEYFVLGVIGVTMIGLISTDRNMLVRGMIVGFLGLLIGTIGLARHTGLPRYTLGFHYLWEGVPLIPVILGLFALPEMIDSFTRNTTISQSGKYHNSFSSTLEGLRDCAQNIPLLLRSSTIGAFVGVIPALGGPVAQWMAYGAAKKTVRNAERLGTGDIRGVISPQAAVAADKPGGMIPTLVFGVPGDVVMAILLGAFLILGIRPGPEMLGENLHISFMMMWIVVIGNALAVSLALLMGSFFIKITVIPPSILVPVLLCSMITGSFVATGSIWDAVTFFVVGILAYVMEITGWPRIPLILGLVLSDILETYLFVSYDAYGYAFLFRPLVIIMLAATALLILSWVLKGRFQLQHFRNLARGKGK